MPNTRIARDDKKEEKKKDENSLSNEKEKIKAPFKLWPSFGSATTHSTTTTSSIISTPK
jgi:hypothetical protein